MPSNNSSRVLTALVVAVVIFLVAVVLPKFIISGAVARIATTQALELLLALAAIAVLGKARFSDYGFCLPKADPSSPQNKHRWLLIAAIAPFLGIVATVAVLGLGGKGSPAVKNLSFPQIVLFVWVFSSIIEEIFTRGFLQGHLSVLSGRYVKLPFCRVELPVLISALFFACMHLILPFVGADATTTVVIWLFTFSIGLLAGYLRSKTGSLIPAIVVHVLANIGGMIGGILFTIVRILMGAPPPGM